MRYAHGVVQEVFNPHRPFLTERYGDLRVRIYSRSTRFLTLAVAAVVLAGCGVGGTQLTPAEHQEIAFNDLRAAVERAVVNQENEEEIIKLVDQLEREIIALRDTKVRRRAEFRQRYLDYDASREELQAFAEEIEASLQANRRRLLNARNLLVENTTEDEWASIMKAETEATKAMFASLRLL
jgi:hypothetical protein